MLLSIVRRIVCLFLMVNSTLLYASDSFVSEVRIASGEWPPFLSEHQHGVDIAGRIVSEAFDAVGIKTEFGYFPWRRSYQFALTGKDQYDVTWHASAVWLSTPEREKLFFYSDPVIETNEAMFYLKSAPLSLDDAESLTGKRFGGTAYTPYPLLEELESQGKIQILRSGHDATLLQRLLYREMDACLITEKVGIYYMMQTLTEEERSQIAYTRVSEGSRPLHLLFSRNVKENAGLVKRFNYGLKIIRKNGVYDAVFNAYSVGTETQGKSTGKP